MAIQHFADGGFTGQLGATVGFYRGGKYILRVAVPHRSYVPENQKRTIKKFVEGVAYAHWGQAMNWKCGTFPSYYSDWTGRCAVAAKLRHAGQIGLAGIPLCEIGYTPAFTATGVGTPQTLLSEQVLVPLVGTFPNVDRVLSVAFQTQNTGVPDDDFILSPAKFSVSDGNAMILPPGAERFFVPGNSLVFASSDDNLHDKTAFISEVISW